tara:strand:- start:248 stop:436 length:189 start_codon:yes stop_codon:yes gene_type:complete
MKTAEERIKEMTEQQMDYNLSQIQHILNGLVDGEIFDGSKLDMDKLIDYKLSISKLRGLKIK